MIQGIHHVALKCGGEAELDRTIKFYTDILGLKPLRFWGEGTERACMLDTGAGCMELFANATEDLPQGAIRHFAFDMSDPADVDIITEKVRELGYPIVKEPTDIMIDSVPKLPARISFFLGPVGEEIELFAMK